MVKNKTFIGQTLSFKAGYYHNWTITELLHSLAVINILDVQPADFSQDGCLMLLESRAVFSKFAAWTLGAKVHNGTTHWTYYGSIPHSLVFIQMIVMTSRDLNYCLPNTTNPAHARASRRKTERWEKGVMMQTPDTWGRTLTPFSAFTIALKQIASTEHFFINPYIKFNTWNLPESFNFPLIKRNFN